MKSLTIQGKKRENVGKHATKALRNAELVPCVVYGGDKPVHFSTEEKSFKSLVYTPEAHTVVLQLEDGTTINAILQDVQFHAVSDKILHADFYQLHDDKPVTLEIPVRLEGRSKGVLAGGSLRFNMRKLKVKAIPANLPDQILIDITSMRIGAKRYISSLRNEKFTILHPDNSVVVAVRTSRASAKGGAAVMDDDDETETTEDADATDNEGADENPAAEA